MKKSLLNRLKEGISKKKIEVYDASGYVLGRFLSVINKVEGTKIGAVINADKLILRGKPKYLIAKYQARVKSGNKIHGPFVPRTPNMLAKRIYGSMCSKNSKILYFMDHEDVPAERKINKNIRKNDILGPQITLAELCKAI